MDEHRPLTLGEKVAWTGTVLVGLLCILRAMIEHDPFPWWSSDPFVFAPPIVGLTPRWALLLNIGIVLASFVMLVGQHLRGIGLGTSQGILTAIGLGTIAYHASADLERVLDASTIAAVICALLVGMQAFTLPGATRVLGAVILGFGTMITAIGIYEVYVTHPETMRMYEQTRDSFLAARGWSPDSFEAMSYERRLGNPEPIAWFGLTNVFASFVAATGSALITLGVAAWRDKRTLSGVSFAGALISVIGLSLCSSKGGYAVFLIGVAFGLLVLLKPRVPGGRVMIGLCVLVLLTLVARGLIGESLGERSLLFRFQYLVGSVRVWLADPVLGIGPGMFQDGYALLKPALSTEDVATPHNVAFAWIATLGAGGIALVMMLARALIYQPRATEAIPEEQSGLAKDQLIKLGLLIIVIATLISLRMQIPVLTQTGLIPILVGLVGWCIITASVTRSELPDQVLRAVLLVLGGVLLVHAMIEVSGSLIVSAPLWGLGVGLAIRPAPSGKTTRVGNSIAALTMIALSIILLARWAPINRWERSLHASAERAHVIAEVNSALNALEFAPVPERLLDRAAQQLSTLLGTQIDNSLDSVVNTMHQAEFLSREEATGSLLQALEARPTHTPSRIAISQQHLWLASVLQGVGQTEQASREWDRAVKLFETERLDTQGHRWLSSIQSGRASAYRDAPERDAWLREAVRNAEIAMSQTPHDPHLAHQIMMLHLELEDAEQARIWGLRAIELHDQTRLDPIRGLSDSELGVANEAASDP